LPILKGGRVISTEVLNTHTAEGAFATSVAPILACSNPRKREGGRDRALGKILASNAHDGLDQKVERHVGGGLIVAIPVGSEVLLKVLEEGLTVSTVPHSCR
jgi:hypothetical protein